MQVRCLQISDHVIHGTVKLPLICTVRRGNFPSLWWMTITVSPSFLSTVYRNVSSAPSLPAPLFDCCVLVCSWTETIDPVDTPWQNLGGKKGLIARVLASKITRGLHTYSWSECQVYTHAQLICQRTERATYNESETMYKKLSAGRIQISIVCFCIIHFHQKTFQISSKTLDQSDSDSIHQLL